MNIEGNSSLTPGLTTSSSSGKAWGRVAREQEGLAAEPERQRISCGSPAHTCSEGENAITAFLLYWHHLRNLSKGKPFKRLHIQYCSHFKELGLTLPFS